MKTEFDIKSFITFAQAKDYIQQNFITQILTYLKGEVEGSFKIVGFLNYVS